MVSRHITGFPLTRVEGPDVRVVRDDYRLRINAANSVVSWKIVSFARLADLLALNFLEHPLDGIDNVGDETDWSLYGH